MTIEEVHKQAAKEQADAARASANAVREGNMSRGGSKRGGERGGAGGYGNLPTAGNQWQSVGNRPPAKIADMTGFGNIKIGGGPSSFGPSWAFGKNKSKTGEATPPISRTASRANMFSALENADSGELSAGEEQQPAEEQPQRKKLNLAPRSVAANPASAPEAEADAEAESKPKGTVEDNERRIRADLAEFWGEKGTVGTRNTEDLVAYFKALNEEGRAAMSKQLVDDVFRLAKMDDTKLVADGLEKAIASDVLTKEAAKAR